MERWKGKGGGEGGQGKGLVAQWVLLHSGKWLEKKWQGRRMGKQRVGRGS